MSSEQELIERVKRGEVECFRTLFEKYGQRLFNVVLHLVGDYEEANDVVQEAFVKAYQAINTFRSQSRFYTWLYRIGVNQARDHLRRRKSQPSTVPLEDLGTEDSVSAPNRDRRRQAVDRILASLTPDAREIMLLREAEGFSYEEIAEILGISPGTVKSRLARARADVRLRFGSAKNVVKEL